MIQTLLPPFMENRLLLHPVINIKMMRYPTYKT